MSTAEHRKNRGTIMLNTEIKPQTKEILREMAKRQAEEMGVARVAIGVMVDQLAERAERRRRK